jgi:hypothetical protein
MMRTGASMIFLTAIALVFMAGPRAAAETLPNILPAGTVAEPLTFTSASGQLLLETPATTEIAVPSSLGEASGTSEQAGTFHIA